MDKNDWKLEKTSARLSISVDMKEWDTGGELPMDLRKAVVIEIDEKYQSVEIRLNSFDAILSAMKAGIECFFDSEWKLSINGDGVHVESCITDERCVMHALWSEAPIADITARDRIVAMLQSLQFDEFGHPA